jgi:aryl-alcohol dehydrogenase-like predicted oxidoreductase
MLPGKATASGTSRRSSRFPAQRAAGFYRQAQDLWLSNIGIGTYLGEANDATDAAYTESVTAAVRGGINVIDSAINYRHQRSERAIGKAIAALAASGEINRDEVVICTKAGFLVPGVTPADVLADSEVVSGVHSMAPVFLEDQIERSRTNLGVESIDVFYLHNPETQLSVVSPDRFYERVEAAFERLEQFVSDGTIGFYGVATWDGLRKPPGAPHALSLDRLVETAAQVAGGEHHFRFVQLPFNLSMPEAFVRQVDTLQGEPATILEYAAARGITVVASASLMQARLAVALPEEMGRRISGASTNAQRAIQFARSAPGITTALVGMSNGKHLLENLGIAALSAIQPGVYASLFR